MGQVENMVLTEQLCCQAESCLHVIHPLTTHGLDQVISDLSRDENT